MREAAVSEKKLTETSFRQRKPSEIQVGRKKKNKERKKEKVKKKVNIKYIPYQKYGLTTL